MTTYTQTKSYNKNEKPDKKKEAAPQASGGQKVTR